MPQSPAPFFPLPDRLRRWDIFCNVIDNFGDIGVCWRLARQLATEYGAQVRLWVDDLAAFHLICPPLDPQLSAQQIALHDSPDARRIEVCRWLPEFPACTPGDVVIEAFACRLPNLFEEKMAACSHAPIWINLDYLSAEDWVANCHALPSPHPRLQLTKYFFFPGFDSNSGGLLRERDLDFACKQFRAATSDQHVFWCRLGFPPPNAGTILVSLFAYDNPALPALLEAWSKNDRLICLLLPPTRTQAGVEKWLGTSLPTGSRQQRGALEIRAIPFVSQPEYDQLLWLCDLNFVRGEDSFVRAQWAGVPLVWHIYPQQEEAHKAKLEAFLARYSAGLSEQAARAVHDLHAAWNGFSEPNDVGIGWREWQENLPQLNEAADSWRKKLQKQEDLCAALVRFCRSKL